MTFLSWKKPTTASAVQAEEARLAGEQAELEGKIAALAAEIEVIESTGGEAYLDGSGAEVMRRLLEARIEHEMACKALAVLRARRQELEASKSRVQAEELRSQAAAKRRELEDLRERTAKHLRALAELEGVEYSSFVLNAMPVKRIKPVGRKTPDMLSPADLPWSSMEQPTYQQPRSLKLALEILALDREAAKLDPPAGGPAAA